MRKGLKEKLKTAAGRFLARRGYAPPGNERPLTVFLDLHDSCNLRCRMCHFGFRKDKPVNPHFISRDDFRRLADNVFPFTRELALSPCTEPLFHPDLSGILETIEPYKIPNFWLMTNANLLTREIAETLIRMKATRLLISLDSHKKEIYEGIKVGSDFERVVSNIKMLRDLKKARGAAHPEINVNCLLMRSNIEHVEGYLEFLRDIGVTKVGFFHVIVFKDADQMRGESLFHHQALANEYLDRIPRKAREAGIEIERLPEKFPLESPQASPVASKKGGGPKCRYPWYLVVADHRGDFRPCEFWFGQEPFGNLVATPFAKMWNSGRYRRLRKELATGRLTRSCCLNCVSMSSPDGRSADEKAFVEVEG